MQLGEAKDPNIFRQQNFYKEQHEVSHGKNNHADESSQEAEGEYEAEGEEEGEDYEEHHESQEGHDRYAKEESENEEEENPPLTGMQSKFTNLQMENARMFDDDLSQDKSTSKPVKNQQMEPIEEGYSSEESFGTQQKQKYFQENLQFILQQNKKNEANAAKSNKNITRSHINLKTGNIDNKENVNSRNKKIEEKRTAPEAFPSKQANVGLKRPGTANKLRTSTGFKTAYTRPQTASSSKKQKRPSTAMMGTPSVFSSSTKKSLKSKMIKKSDPVSRYQTMKNSWSKSKFLSQHKGTKQGRKLDLAGFNQWAKLVQNSQQKPVLKQVHRFINPNDTPTMNKRDELRFHLRAKISQEDYLDKDMKLFHYSKASKV